MNIQDEIKALKERIVELEEQEKQEREFPQYMDIYYYIQASGRVDKKPWSESVDDFKVRRLGNTFRTKEEAEFTVEKLKVEAELRKFSKPFKCGEINQYIFLDTDRDRIDVENRYYFPTQGTTYFDSKEKVLKAIDTVGADRIKKYIFGVEE